MDKRVIFSAAFFFAMLSFSYADQITLTTYYPAPAGRYDEMRANRLAVGAGYVDPAVTVPDDALIVSGNVGIGVENPIFALDVVGRSRFQRAATDASSGIWFTNAANTASRAFVGMANDNNIMFWGNGGANQGFNMNVNNGNVGIGTASPAAKLEVRGGNLNVATGRVQEGGVNIIPTGMIALFSGACPAGWTRFAALDNRFPIGSATYGLTGGAVSHAHPVSGRTAGNNGGASGGDYTDCANEGVVGAHTGTSCANYSVLWPAWGHTHDYNNAMAAGATVPPYLSMIFCSKN